MISCQTLTKILPIRVFRHKWYQYSGIDSLHQDNPFHIFMLTVSNIDFLNKCVISFAFLHFATNSSNYWEGNLRLFSSNFGNGSQFTHTRASFNSLLICRRACSSDYYLDLLLILSICQKYLNSLQFLLICRQACSSISAKHQTIISICFWFWIFVKNISTLFNFFSFGQKRF